MSTVYGKTAPNYYTPERIECMRQNLERHEWRGNSATASARKWIIGRAGVTSGSAILCHIACPGPSSVAPNSARWLARAALEMTSTRISRVG
ncbi:MAG: hypothetical protein HPY44_13055 [Armatimonadetes bacterium]|nr:hypothetical protein [Armatimonadota bacterium]